MDGYRCESVVRSPEAGAEWLLGSHRADTPSEAMRWLRRQAVRLVRALDPEPGACPFPAGALHPADPGASHVGSVFRDWLDDIAHQEVQREALASGRYVCATAGMPDQVVGSGAAYLYVSLSCRPLVTRRLGGVGRKGPHQGEVPP
ncbi:hypothetical protein GCM10027160_04820 [Streptomyces calidiresistens]